MTAASPARNPSPHEQLAILLGGTVRDADTIVVGSAHWIRTSVAGVVRLDDVILGSVADGPLALAQAFDAAVSA